MVVLLLAFSAVNFVTVCCVFVGVVFDLIVLGLFIVGCWSDLPLVWSFLLVGFLWCFFCGQWLVKQQCWVTFMCLFVLIRIFFFVVDFCSVGKLLVMVDFKVWRMCVELCARILDFSHMCPLDLPSRRWMQS